MYHIYTTPAFVIDSIAYGEAGKFLFLFTRDFGMIGAVAQGVRLSKSKLRYHVQNHGFVNISIVKGKEVWRLTGAHEVMPKKVFPLHMKIFKLLKRLLAGEEKNEKLFEILETFYKVQMDKSFHETIEYITVLRILHTLGYVSNKSLEPFLKDYSIEESVIGQATGLKSEIIKTINKALEQSHL